MATGWQHRVDYAVHLRGLCLCGSCKLACSLCWPRFVLAWVSSILREKVLWQRLIPALVRANLLGVFEYGTTKARAKHPAM